MNKNFSKIKELDGKQLYYSFLAGAQRIFENQKLLNKINVFPVPDADTGTNMASTMRSITDTSIPTGSLKQTATAIADAALVGARGNSGIIFAQFLYGFSNEIKTEKNINVNSFAEIIDKSVNYAYEAIANPVEGTIITVIKDWAESVNNLKDKIDDFKKLITDSYQKAKQSLIETTEKLEVLKKANVVDAGAKAFVLFLEGMIDFFKHGELKQILSSRNIVKVSTDEIDMMPHDEITFRYCTEALLVGDNLNKQKIINKIEKYGDSIVVAGSPKKLRIHIHTDEPAEIFLALYNHGSIAYQKVDDMVFQNEILHNRKTKIALVTDSTSDLPQDIIEKYQIHIVPLSVHFGDNYYLDGVTITPNQFYKLLNKSKVYPSTAQPAFKDFSNKYSYLSTLYESIIAMHISKEMSGTWQNSRKAAKTISSHTKNNISVLNSKRLSNGLGLILLRAAKAIENGATYDDILNNMDKWIKNSKMLISSKTIKFMVKSGRVSAMKGFIGKLLNLKPIVIVNDEGTTELIGKPFTEKASMRIVMDEAKKLIKTGKVWEYAVSHANNIKTANWYAKQLKDLIGKKPVFIRDVTPVLGVNVGPGVVSVAIMME